MAKHWPTSSELGVYVHFPYCTRRCPYCDFNVHRVPNIPHQDYRDQILTELVQRAPRFHGPAVSVYFGGGTPALWEPDCIESVIQAVHQTLGLTADAEITVEANPEDITLARLQGLKAAGTNRLSLGTQSFIDARLQALGRHHSAAQNREAVQLARKVGFNDLSLDLIWGLVGDTEETLAFDVCEACDLDPTHLSTYELSIEEDTPFGHRSAQGETLEADEDTRVRCLDLLPQLLEARGLIPYEVSNAAKPGFHAVHNTLYWVMAPYLGLGAGASGFETLSPRVGYRYENPRMPTAYAQSVAAPDRGDRVEGRELDEEAIMVGLRLRQGLTLRDDLYTELAPRIQDLVTRGYLTCENHHIAATTLGRRFLNRLIIDLWD